MTEAEWLRAEQLDELMIYLDRAKGRKLRERKRRLLNCACARRALHLLEDDRFVAAIDASERMADGLLTWNEMKVGARRAVVAARDRLLALHAPIAQSDAAIAVLETTRKETINVAMAYAQVALVGRWGTNGFAEVHREKKEQLPLVRDIFCNPFRPVNFTLEWRSSTTIAIAKQMYESRDFSAMPILADALQDAGCENTDILTHCRDTNAVHVRGCWVVDAVLGKE